jgi:hypothetical protein
MEINKEVGSCIADIADVYDDMDDLKGRRHFLFEKLAKVAEKAGMSEDEAIKALEGAIFDGEIDDFVDYLFDHPMYEEEGENDEL